MEDVTFVEMAIELCDGRLSDVERAGVDVTVCGDRAINRWRYRFDEGDGNSVRGVTLIKVRDNKIVEALGYAKTPARSDLGQNRP